MQSVETNIETDLFKHFQNQDFSFYDEQKVGKLMSHITTDAYNLTNVIKSTPEIILSFSIRFLAVFTFLFF
jgi:ATP-binding cassette subfamily B protein